MTKQKSLKRKIITAVIVICGVILLIGSFFVRDIMISGGLMEYERKEIISVQKKYFPTLEKIALSAVDKGELYINVKPHGILDKVEFTFSEKGSILYEELKEEIDVLCHKYCFGIRVQGNQAEFYFNKTGSKMLIYSKEKPTQDDAEGLSQENWYYYEEKQG